MRRRERYVRYGSVGRSVGREGDIVIEMFVCTRTKKIQSPLPSVYVVRLHATQEGDCPLAQSYSNRRVHMLWDSVSARSCVPMSIFTSEEYVCKFY